MYNTISHKLTKHRAAQFHEKLELAKTTSLNIILKGESGVGKEYFAKQIHEKRNCSQEFVIFDWECNNSSQLRIVGDLSKNHLSKIFDINNKKRNTYFFRRIDILSPQMQLEIFELLESEAKRWGLSRSQLHQLDLIATVEKTIETSSRDKILVITQLTELFPLMIRIPALRQRKNELVYLMYAMLDSVNSQLNRKVSGFSPETFSFFLAYNWSNNMDELRSEIEREVALTRDNHLIIPGVLSERLIKLQKFLGIENYLIG